MNIGSCTDAIQDLFVLVINRLLDTEFSMNFLLLEENFRKTMNLKIFGPDFSFRASSYTFIWFQ